MKNIFTVLILFVSVWFFSKPVYAQKIKDDPLSLAALMIKDQHFLRALSILEKIDPTEETKKDADFNAQRFYTLKGITYLNTEQYSQAIESFLEITKKPNVKPVIHTYLAQAYYKNGDYSQAIAEIDKAPSEKQKKSSLILIKFDSFNKLKRPFKAWDALKEGERLFPDDERFPKQQVFSLIEHGFYKQAAEVGIAFTQKFNPEPSDYIAIGTALSQAGDFELAGKFLEQAKLFFPDDVKANKALANFYAQKGYFYNAARIMEPIAGYDNNLMTEAAELNKKAHNFVRARFLNSRSNDQAEKLKQRLSLYLESEDYELAASMERDLKRSKVFKDDNVKYALAYAMFKSGDFEGSELVLSQIRDGRIFKNANIIRKTMNGCKENKWRCM